MPIPSFPTLNGQVKTPLRWYASELDLNEATERCREQEGCEFALLSKADALPPFQIRSEPGAGMVSAWSLLYANDGTVAVDLFSEISLLSSYLFSGSAYTVYKGDELSVILAQDTYRMTMVIDGVTYYSERFRIGCSGELINEEFDSLAGWTYFGSGINTAVRVVNVVGNPSQSGLSAGDKVINLNDERIYTWSGTSWSTSNPTNPSYWYVEEDDNWLYFDGAFNGVSSPVAISQVDGDWRVCWAGDPAVTLVFAVDGILSVFNTYVYEFEIGSATTGSLIVSGPGFEQESTGGETLMIESYMDNANPIVLVPQDGWDGCVTRVTVRTKHTFEQCAGELRWSHCSPVGNVYFGQNYENRFWFDRKDATLNSEVTTVTETKEDSRRRTVETLKRKDVEWSLVLGYLPWYLEDALTELPQCDTIELRMPGKTTWDTLRQVSVVAEQDEVGGDCLKLVTVKFRLDEATVSTGCCGPFDAPCSAPCVTNVLGFFGDESSSGTYIRNDSPTYYTYNAILGTRTPAVACASRIVQTDESFGAHRLLYWTGGGGWLALCEITEAACSGGVLSLTANMQGAFIGLLQVSYDSGSTWVDDAHAYSASELGSGVEMEVTGSATVRIKIMGADDCLIGYSTAEEFTCA